MFNMKEWCQVLRVAYWAKSRRRDLIVPFKGAEQSALCDMLRQVILEERAAHSYSTEVLAGQRSDPTQSHRLKCMFPSDSLV